MVKRCRLSDRQKVERLPSGSDSVPGTDSVPESDSVPHIRFRTQIRFRTRAEGKIFGYGIGSGTESVWQFWVRNRINYGYGIGNWMMKNHKIPSFKLFTRTPLVRLFENFYLQWWLQIRQWMSYSIQRWQISQKMGKIRKNGAKISENGRFVMARFRIFFTILWKSIGS